MVGFLVSLAINLAIQIALNQLSRLLEPGRKRPRPQPFQSPTASSGEVVGKGFGIFESSGVVVLVHDKALEQDEHEGIPVTRYYAKIVLVLGWGPINMLYDIVSDERSIRSVRPDDRNSYNDHDDVPPDPNIIRPALPFDFDAALTNGREFSINARQLFGGGGEEGGLQGLLMLYPGYQDQPVDPLIAEVDGPDNPDHPGLDYASSYPWTVIARFGAESGRPVGLSESGMNQQGDRFYWTTNTPTPKPITFILGAYPDHLLGDGGRIGIAANAIEVLYEIWTDTKWGMGKPTARFDVAQWAEKAQQIKNENLKISVPRDDQRTADDLSEDILRHIDGGIVEDPATGLLQIKLARADYDFDDLLTVGAHNTENFKRGKPLAPKSINDIQIRYRRYFGGITGDIELEHATEDLDFNLLWHKDGTTYEGWVYGSAATNIEPGSAKAYINDVEVPVIVDDFSSSAPDVVLLNTEKGHWIFIGGSIIVEGARVDVSYAANPKFSAFIDDVATAQNIANQKGRGQFQPESYDYTYYVDAFSAQWKADRLRATLSRVIDTFTWEGKRDQSHLTEWDVVKLLEPKWGITEPIAIRITKVSRGTRTNPRLVFEGVKDVWGEKIFLSDITGGDPPTPPSQFPAPAMAIACGVSGIEDLARIDLFPTGEIYAVEVYEADDGEGTNAVLVNTIAAGTTPMYYSGVPSKYYAARQTSTYTRPGPLTAWITCGGSTEPPVDPTCVVPTYAYTTDDLLGIVLLNTTDPQNRIQLVEYRTRSGNGAWSAWSVGTTPYCFSVILSATETSRIEWRITYLACDGTVQQYLDGYDFVPSLPPPVPPEEPQPVFTQEVEVVLHAGGLWPIGIDEVEIPAEGERLPLTPNKATEVKTPITWAESGHITASFQKSDLPTSLDLSSAYLVIRGRVPATEGAAWRSLGENDTPRLPIDHDTLLAMDDEATIIGDFPVCVEGDPVNFRDEFLGTRLHIAADIVGADGTVLIESILTRLSIWLKKGVVSGPPTEPPENEPLPPYDPGSCDTPDALDMSSGTENDEGGVATTWVRGANSATLTIDGSATGFSRIEETITGLTPDAKHALYIKINTNGRPGVDAFLEAVGQGDAVSDSGSLVELEVIAYSDSAGEIDVRWGVRSIQGAGGGGALAIDTEDYQSVGDWTSDGWSDNTGGSVPPSITFDGSIKESGATSLRFDIVHPAWTSGQRYFEKIFPGYPSGADVEGRVRFLSQGMPWYGNPIFTVGYTTTGLDYETDKNDPNWQTLTCLGGEIDASGNLLVRIGAKTAAGVVENFKNWFDGVIEVDIAGVGTIEIDFADLGICEGSGKGTDGTGVGGDPDTPGNEPIPEPPPGGWPDPPTPLTRWNMIWGISAVGLGPWNATNLRFTPKTSKNILDVCEDHDTYIFMTLGPEADWLLNGAFHEPFWRAQMQALYNDIETRNAIQAASTGSGPYTKVRVAHMVFDEPFHPRRYGLSNGISYAVIERCVIMSKQLFPEMETVLRVDPTDPRYVRKMTGLDSMWAEYSLARGPIDSYITTRVAAAQEWPHYLYFGLHYKHFEGPAGPDPRYITPTEFRHYGRDRIASQPTSRMRGMGGWKYESGLWSQTGFSAAAFETRDRLATSA